MSPNYHPMPLEVLLSLYDGILQAERSWALSVGPEKYFEFLRSNPRTLVQMAMDEFPHRFSSSTPDNTPA